MSQLEDPYNVNFIAPGRESNGSWTKTSFTSSTSNPANLLKQNWSSVATSSDGKYVLACVNGGQIYSSSNYGYNLQPESSSILPETASWSCIKISPDGTKAAACINGGGIYIGTLTGTSWTWESTASATVNWSSVAISGDNLSIAACVSNGSIYIGTYTTYWSWSKNDYSPSGNWSSITFSGNNTNIAACINSNGSGNGIFIGYYDSEISDWNFDQSNSPANWSCITKFGSSKNFVACINNSSSGGIYKGIFNDEDPDNPFWNWSQTSAPSAAWSSVACDSTGQYVVACVNGGGLFCSLDYGSTWKEQTTGLTNPSDWLCVACDNSGSFLLGCVQNDYIYISPYYQGYQWNNSYGLSYVWKSVASDNSGQNIIAGNLGNTIGGYTTNGNIYISNDNGISWTPTNPVGPLDEPTSSQNWWSVTSNDDGSILGAVIFEGAAYISLDYGLNWIQPVLEISYAPQSNQISLNSSGEYGVICSYLTLINDSSTDGRIYISNDTSDINSWVQVSPSPVPPSVNQWTAVKFSSDSNYIYFCCFSSQNESSIYRATYNPTNNTCNFNRIFNAKTGNIPSFSSITCSLTGEYIYAICAKSSLSPTNIYIASNYGTDGFQIASITIPDVTTTEPDYGFQGITTSANGDKIAVTFYNRDEYTGYIYLSLDYGVTWTTQIHGLPTTQNAWQCIASNQDFNKLIIAANALAYNYGGSSGIFTSFLSESCWTPQLNAVPTRNAFTKLTSSNNGKYLAVVAENQTILNVPNNDNDYGGIWISWDNGFTWRKSDAGNFCWNAISSDNTGQYLVAGVYGGQIYTSNNYGLNWVVQSSNSGLPTSAYWCALSFSNNSDPNSTSQYVYAAVASGQTYPGSAADGGYIYFSTDRGLTWAPINLFTTWGNGISSSSNGEFMYVGALTNNSPESAAPPYIYGTYSFGLNLDQVFNNSFGANWNYVATDSTGNYIVAVNTNISSSYSDSNTGIWLGISNLESPPTFTWNQIASKALDWKSISLENLGNYLLITAICTNGLIYSCNYNLVPPPSFLNENYYVSNSNLHPPLPEGVTQYIGFIGYSNGPTANLSIEQEINFPFDGKFTLSFYVAPSNPDNNTIYNLNNNELTIVVSNNVLSEQVIIDPTDWNWVKKSYSLFISTAGSYKFTFNQNITGTNSQDILSSIFFVTGFELTQIPYTWTLKGNLPASQWNDIKSSVLPSGEVQLVMCSTNGGIWKSSDSGETWSQSTFLSISGNNLSITSSSSGQNLVSIVNSDYLYGSTDYGLNWNQLIYGPTSQYWYSIASSITGQYIVASTIDGKVYFSGNYGQSWSSKIIGGSSSLSISSTGQYIVGAAYLGSIYLSSDYGLIWTQLTTTNGLPSNIESWSAISISVTGQYMAATINGGKIYSSSNFGTMWVENNVITASWSSISISNSGQYVAATINGGTIYISFNYGLNWTQLTTTNGLPSNTQPWTSISISGTGQYIFATSNNGDVYNSPDFGLSWSKINTDNPSNPPATANLNSIKSSTSGQYLAAIAVNSLYTSEVDIYNYSNYMDIGNIIGSLINQLQIQLQYKNTP
jgi:photosystem II stability/assembly factor-like uncharacterized protein